LARKKPKKKAFESGKEVKAIARERVGRIRAAKPIEPKASRKKPKHKKREEEGAVNDPPRSG
jgi:hypothetical protein